MHKLFNVLFLILLLAAISCGQQETNQLQPTVNMMDVKVLGVQGCEATVKTIDLVKSVAEAMGVHIDLVRVVIETPEQAPKERFIGSPTVRVNGRDIEPAARATQFFGVT